MIWLSNTANRLYPVICFFLIFHGTALFSVIWCRNVISFNKFGHLLTLAQRKLPNQRKQQCFKFLNQNSLNPTTTRNFINPAKYRIMRAPWPSFADRGYSDNSIRGETSLWRFQLSVILPYKTCRAFVALYDVIQTYGSSSEYKQLPVFYQDFQI